MAATTERTFAADRHPVAIGELKAVNYLVTGSDSVRNSAGLSVVFAEKPPVMASARLVQLCEWPCMEALREHLAPHQCSLGSRQYLDHCGPIAIGARLSITARCHTIRGPYSEWRVDVRDDHEQVGEGTFGFVVVDRVAFEQQRLHRKQQR